MGKLLWENLNILTSCFYSLKRRFFVLEYPKTNFPGLNTLKKQDGKIAIFWPKPWLNPFGKISIEEKWPYFLLVFLRQYRPGKCKNKKFKNSKNSNFSKGFNQWFGPKMAIIPTFFFRQSKPGKCALRYSTTKIRLSRL